MTTAPDVDWTSPDNGCSGQTVDTGVIRYHTEPVTDSLSSFPSYTITEGPVWKTRKRRNKFNQRRKLENKFNQFRHKPHSVSSDFILAKETPSRPGSSYKISVCDEKKTDRGVSHSVGITDQYRVSRVKPGW